MDTIETSRAHAMSKDSAAFVRSAFRDWLPQECTEGRTLWIDGAWSAASDGASFATICPSSGAELLHLATATDADVDRAARSAHRAAPGWWKLEAAARSRILRDIATGIRARTRELSLLETLDAGRPVGDSRYSVEHAAGLFEYYAGLAEQIDGRAVPAGAGSTVLVDREPYGVIAAIAPWNYPLILAATKLAPILGCGNAVIFKPAEQTPLVTLLLARIMQQAGLPDGVANILTGEGETGASMVRHPLVEKISFTGSTSTGRHIAAAAAERLKGTVLELGGKSPLIVFDDAELDRAAGAAVFSTFMNQGQTCTSCNRILVAERVRERFIALCEEKLARIPFGDPFDPATRVGAIVSGEQLARMTEIVGDTASRPLSLPHYQPTSGGNFFRPMIVDTFEPGSRFAREEIFGPVLAVRGFATDEEAYALANDTEYGLAASVWTTTLKRADEARRRIEAGMIWINCVHALPAGAPVAGHKASGLGCEYGPEAQQQYMKIKTTVIMSGGWTSPFEA